MFDKEINCIGAFFDVVEFIEEKRFPSQKKGEYNTPTKHLIKISIEKFQSVKILHNKINYDKEII